MVSWYSRVKQSDRQFNGNNATYYYSVIGWLWFEFRPKILAIYQYSYPNPYSQHEYSTFTVSLLTPISTISDAAIKYDRFDFRLPQNWTAKYGLLNLEGLTETPQAVSLGFGAKSGEYILNILAIFSNNTLSWYGYMYGTEQNWSAYPASEIQLNTSGYKYDWFAIGWFIGSSLDHALLLFVVIHQQVNWLTQHIGLAQLLHILALNIIMLYSQICYLTVMQNGWALALIAHPMPSLMSHPIHYIGTAHNRTTTKLIKVITMRWYGTGLLWVELTNGYIVVIPFFV